ncbi:hypothetical protein AciX8_3406 [Granulicella mallensis MP5ACTX8]|uniref:Uncharacterized protein n=1 Tax=Granulicella mallensis (strain ATCC BAA-1857 / DSM 23137 / MP5ACTX8) TaxID=682795 RepID=G8NVN2_GRAMM|nr:hypothetical protein AciX8_3406 [Granulicella mallensis MP5ACTX8]
MGTIFTKSPTHRPEVSSLPRWVYTSYSHLVSGLPDNIGGPDCLNSSGAETWL